MLTRTDLIREAGATGFQEEPLEKVIRLLELLDALRSHPTGESPRRTGIWMSGRGRTRGKIAA